MNHTVLGSNSELAFLPYFYAGGVLLGGLLIVTLLFLDTRNKNAVYPLVLVVAVTVIMLAEELITYLGATHNFGLGLVLEFAFGPLMYIFARSISEREFEYDRKTLLHFIPLLIALILLILLNRASSSSNISLSDENIGTIIGVWVCIKFFYFFIYAYFSLRKIGWRARRTFKLSGVAHKWLFWWIGITTLAVAFVYLNFFLFWLGVPAVRDSDIVSGIVLSLNTYFFTYFVIQHKESITYVEPYADSKLPKSDVRLLANRIVEYFKTSNAHLNPEFTFKDLSQAVELEDAIVTEVIRREFGIGYYEFLNDLRLTAFTQLLISPNNEKKNVLDLAYEAGFNSKSSFYRIFHAKFGMTPRAFRENSRIEHSAD